LGQEVVAVARVADKESYSFVRNPVTQQQLFLISNSHSNSQVFMPW